MSRPLLLVDVDGVLNCFGWKFGEGYDDDFSDVFEEIFDAPARGKDWTIRLPRGIKGRMAVMNEVFDCVWATTWEFDAQTGIAPTLGVGQDWPVITWSSGEARMFKTWKLPDVQKWVEENADGRAVAWVDDDLQEDAERWAQSRTELHAPTALVSCKHDKGFTESLELRLLEWANSLEVPQV